MSISSIFLDLFRSNQTEFSVPEAGTANQSIDVLVLDVSGSMVTPDYPPNRWQAALGVASSYIETCRINRPDGLIALQAFSSISYEIIPPTPTQWIDTSTLGQGYEPGGCTNHEAGLDAARLAIASVAGAIAPRVIMLTDGHNTSGNPPGELAWNMINSGIEINIIGIGSRDRVNESYLRTLASTGNTGREHYWFIDDWDGLTQRFESLALRSYE